MTVSSTIRKAGPATGNGITTQFPFAFKIFTASDLQVVRTDLSAVDIVLALGTDYTVTVNANQDAAPGGTVTLIAPLPLLFLLTITSVVPNKQPVLLTNQGAFYPAIINDALDRATIQIQQLAEQVDRCFKVPVSSLLGPGASVQSYVDAAALSATSSANSATASANSATASANSAATASTSAAASGVSAAASAASAAAASAAATLAIAPTTSAIASYIDTFFPVAQWSTFTSIYAPGGWDLGSIAPTPVFINETTPRRVSLATGSGSFNFGAVP